MKSSRECAIQLLLWHLTESGQVVALYCFSVWTSEGLNPAECAEKRIIHLFDYLKISSLENICENTSSWINLDITFPSILLQFKWRYLSCDHIKCITQHMSVCCNSMPLGVNTNNFLTKVNVPLGWIFISLLHAVYCTLLHIVNCSEKDSDSESCKNAVEDICVCQVLMIAIQVQSVQLKCPMLDNGQLSPPCFLLHSTKSHILQQLS
jgi:hypothetical protein